MRIIMESYPHEIACHGYEFYFQRYLTIMEKKRYAGREKFEELAKVLWEHIKNLPQGFLHGDLHTGNMFQTEDGIVTYDFDACALASPVYDIATLCDATDYFNSNETVMRQGWKKTQQNVAEVLKGYEAELKLTKEEKQSIGDMIAIRHFDIQATIIESQGIHCVDDAFLNHQYQWLEQWIKISKERVGH